jgi:cyclopropane fatty-acyl-phospholipid synthase-like methyltransferase
MLQEIILPDQENPYGWWNTFWINQPNRFGAPSSEITDLIDKLHTKRFASAVDIASGNGRYALHMASIGIPTHAIELTQSGIDLIKRNAASKGLDVTVEKNDFLLLCQQRREYDLVVCSGLLEEIPQKRHMALIQGMRNWMSNKGTLILKFCPEIFGRGNLVDTNEICRHILQSGLAISYSRESSEMKVGRAGTLLRTATIVGMLEGE